ncbi:MAG: prepilin peptidase [Pseudomonadota bacterium]
MTPYEGVIAALLAASLVLAAFNDLKRFQIPNAIVVFIILLFLARAPLLASEELIARLVGAALILSLGFGLFLAGRFGAGDAKLLFAIALHTPTPLIAPALLALSLCGLLALGVIALMRARALRADKALSAIDETPPPPEHAAAPHEGWRQWGVWRERDRFPYGYPIASAGVLIIAAEAALRLSA